MSLTAIIVRHGNTFSPGETPRRIGARTDIPLVASGQAQAQALATIFAADAPFDRVLTGPLRRTQETARVIAERQRCPVVVETHAWLAEIDHGPDEDQTEDVVLARVGASALRAWDEAGEAPAGWTVDAARRIAAWQALLANATGRIAIVTSNGAARFALLAHPDLRAQAGRLASMKLRTGAWGRIAQTGGMFSLGAWDQRP